MFFMFIIYLISLKHLICIVYVITHHNQLFFITLIVNISFTIFIDNFLIYVLYINDNNLYIGMILYYIIY